MILAKNLVTEQKITFNGRTLFRMDMQNEFFPDNVVIELNEMQLIAVPPATDLNQLFPLNGKTNLELISEY